VTSLFDTGVLIDYLTGRPEAAEVFAAQTFGAISVVSWVELMSVAPFGLEEATRTFLQRFERLALNEAIADRAVAAEPRGCPMVHRTRGRRSATRSVNAHQCLRRHDPLVRRGGRGRQKLDLTIFCSIVNTPLDFGSTCTLTQ
jgi:predicted nucleic acid-binding protein